jgi:hypothetical protein
MHPRDVDWEAIRERIAEERATLPGDETTATDETETKVSTSTDPRVIAARAFGHASDLDADARRIFGHETDDTARRMFRR